MSSGASSCSRVKTRGSNFHVQPSSVSVIERSATAREVAAGLLGHQPEARQRLLARGVDLRRPVAGRDEARRQRHRAVDDHERLDQLGVPVGRRRRDAPAHAVADHDGGAADVASITAATSSAQVDIGYASRRPLSPWPERSSDDDPAAGRQDAGSPAPTSRCARRRRGRARAAGRRRPRPRSRSGSRCRRRRSHRRASRSSAPARPSRISSSRTSCGSITRSSSSRASSGSGSLWTGSPSSAKPQPSRASSSVAPGCSAVRRGGRRARSRPCR